MTATISAFPARGRAAALALLFMAAAPWPAPAQELALKRTAVPGDAPASVHCPRFPRARPPAPAQQEQAKQRATLGMEAAVGGNQRAARELLESAALLDPTAESIAYQLARVLEESGAADQAASEYCRYLALAPNAPDTADVRARLVALLPQRPAAPSELAVAPFMAGISHYDHGRLREAEGAFTEALAQSPRWADAYFNRAVVLLAEGDSTRAAADFRRYLEIRPDAEERAMLLARTVVPPGPRAVSPTVALTRGLMLPGLGQFYTHRPVLGGLTLAAAGTAVYVALRRDEVVRRVTFTDPGGTPREFQEIAHERRHLTAGLVAAGAITVLGALEAYLHAGRQRDGAAAAATGGAHQAARRRLAGWGPAISGTIVPAPGDFHVGLRIALP